MSIHTNKSVKSNPQPQDFATLEDFARARREIHAPAECHSGTNCWRILGTEGWDRKNGVIRTPRCLGCGGKIRFMRYVDWAPLLKDLRRLFADGLSATEIAVRLGVSKNAVIGKLHRLGLVPSKRRV